MLMMNFVHAPATTADHGQPVHLIYTVTFQSASFFFQLLSMQVINGTDEIIMSPSEI